MPSADRSFVPIDAPGARAALAVRESHRRALAIHDLALTFAAPLPSLLQGASKLLSDVSALCMVF